MSTAPALTLRPYSAKTFTAFRVTESNRTYPVALHRAHVSIDQALIEALSATLLLHKETLIIRETDDGAATLHMFRIRKSKPRWVRRGFETVREEPLYAEKLCAVDGVVLGEGLNG